MKLKNFLTSRIGGVVLFFLILITAFVLSPRSTLFSPKAPEPQRLLTPAEQQWSRDEEAVLRSAIATLSSCNPRQGCYAPDSASVIADRIHRDEKRSQQLLDPILVKQGCEELKFAGYGHMQPDSCD